MDGQIQVGSWLVEPSLNTVSRNGTTIHLEPKVMEVLLCLSTHAGEVLSKEALLQTVWPDTFVTDDALKHCISDLRRVLEDNAREPRVIETIPKRGYRLVAPVVPANGARDSPTQATLSPVISGAAGSGTRRMWRWVAVGGAVLISALLIALRGRQTDAGAVPPIHSLAVLPLQNLSADPAQEYFSDGLTDALITDLAQLGSVKVISRTSSMQYKQTRKSLLEIARELNVDGIVEGTVQRSGDRVRITAQLIHGPSDKHIWAASYERDTHDVFTLEREVTGDIANQVKTQLATQGQASTVPFRPVNLKALEAYLQGDYHLHKADMGPLDEEKRKAQKYFEEAISEDPNFASAYVGLARAHQNLAWSAKDDLASIRAAAEKAVNLDPASSDAHVILGEAKGEAWDDAGEEEEYRQALALNPNNALAHADLGGFLADRGRREEGWREYEIAQQLDPNQDHLSWTLYYRGEYDRAIDLLLKLAANHPQDGTVHFELGQNYLQRGEYQKWVEEVGTSMTLFGFPEVASPLQHAFATSGYTGAMRQWVRELEQLNASKRAYLPGVLAQAYSALGDKDRAFYWLEQGYEHRDRATADPYLHSLDLDPGFAPLRSDPRYLPLLRRMRLPQ